MITNRKCLELKLWNYSDYIFYYIGPASGRISTFILYNQYV